MKIFVSYTIRDNEINRNYLDILNKKLQKFADVFVDLIHNDSENPQQRIESEISNSNVLLLINTRHISESNWVHFEIEKAKSLGIPIIALSRNDALTDALDKALLEYF